MLFIYYATFRLPKYLIWYNMCKINHVFCGSSLFSGGMPNIHGGPCPLPPKEGRTDVDIYGEDSKETGKKWCKRRVNNNDITHSAKVAADLHHAPAIFFI